ncbi:unnamed protein product [Parnassius apollo]|uniref:(apollo) hypothetical protein n=1 Tax=Parnassius apollo TaxID=110799 RepID=A0A8S3XTS0_PARAO|nr:unnamed protein product [Parnassius apollo]
MIRSPNGNESKYNSQPDLSRRTEEESNVSIRKRKKMDHDCDCKAEIQGLRSEVSRMNNLLENFVISQEKLMTDMRENIKTLNEEIKDNQILDFGDSKRPGQHQRILWNVTEDSDTERFQYYYGFIEQVADVSFRTNLQNFWKYQNDDTVKNIDLLQLARNVHPNMTLPVTVTQTNEKVQWIPVMTEEGVCLTLNSVYAEYQFLLKEIKWKQQDLLKCHYHSEQCFVRIDSASIEVRYFVHSPYDIATAISNPTGEVMPGEELLIDFKVVEIQAAIRLKSLTPEQRRCRYPDEWLSNSIKSYSFGLCQMNCRNRMAVMFCGCRPYFFNKGGEVYIN